MTQSINKHVDNMLSDFVKQFLEEVSLEVVKTTEIAGDTAFSVDFTEYHSSFLSSTFRNILAKIAPEILCHTEKTAPGTVAIARFGNAVPASDVASPEFCIPISIDNAFFLEAGSLSNLPSKYPHPYPNTL